MATFRAQPGVTGCPHRVTNKPGDSGKGVQFLNMSHSSFSMGVLPMVRRKKSSSTRSEEMKRSAGRSSSSFPNLGMEQWPWVGVPPWCHP